MNINAKLLTRIVLACTTLLCAVQTAQARNDMLLPPIKDVLKMGRTRGIIENMNLYFGDQSPERSIKERMGNVVVTGKADPYIYHSTRTERRDDEPTCREAMQKAIKAMVDQARERGGDGIVQIVSNYNNVERSSTTEYECHAGNMRAVVELKGVVVKFVDGR